MSENRVVVGLPARYESAKNAVREYECRIAAALHYANTLPAETRDTIHSILLGYKSDDDSV